MIKASELRIGNWVYINGIAVQLNRKTLSTILDKDGEITRCAGITLTPEILEKYGFVKNGSYYCLRESVNDSRACIRIAELEGIFHISIGDDEFGIAFRVIKYLHELQNVYYIIESEELEIELN